jgi:hypothetical protein
MYCYGIGVTSEDCELKRGLPRLSAVGPRVPTLLAAVSRRFRQGAWAMRIRTGRACYARPSFAPSKSCGIVLHSGNWIMVTQELCKKQMGSCQAPAPAPPISILRGSSKFVHRQCSDQNHRPIRSGCWVFLPCCFSRLHP